MHGDHKSAHETVQLTRGQTILFAVLTVAVGPLMSFSVWIYSQGANAAQLKDHERRLTNIETNYTPMVVNEQMHKAVNDQHKSLETRLDRIEGKVDRILQERR